MAYILNDKRKNENFREYASFFEWLLDLPEKKLYFDFLANFGHFGVFHRHKKLFTVQKCENVRKDLLESKTVCWFEVFKEGKQDKVSILLFSVLRLGIVKQKYRMAETCTDPDTIDFLKVHFRRSSVTLLAYTCIKKTT